MRGNCIRAVTESVRIPQSLLKVRGKWRILEKNNENQLNFSKKTPLVGKGMPTTKF